MALDDARARCECVAAAPARDPRLCETVNVRERLRCPRARSGARTSGLANAVQRLLSVRLRENRQHVADQDARTLGAQLRRSCDRADRDILPGADLDRLQIAEDRADLLVGPRPGQVPR